MSFNDLITNKFSPADWAALDNALNTIETVLQGKVVNLTPDERRQYGSVKETHKLFINKVKDYLVSHPGLAPTVMDTTEFQKDYIARTEIDTRLRRLNAINEMLDDTQTAFDWDNYQASLSFYNFVKYQSSENVPGTSVIFADLQQFFATGPRGTGNADTPPAQP